ncbi:hypothetical protein [Yersinia frederiksenii]|nr:hypothetical protein [Yersinia frederiksenii]
MRAADIVSLPVSLFSANSQQPTTTVLADSIILPFPYPPLSDITYQ